MDSGWVQVGLAVFGLILNIVILVVTWYVGLKKKLDKVIAHEEWISEQKEAHKLENEHKTQYESDIDAVLKEHERRITACSHAINTAREKMATGSQLQGLTAKVEGTGQQSSSLREQLNRLVKETTDLSNTLEQYKAGLRQEIADIKAGLTKDVDNVSKDVEILTAGIETKMAYLTKAEELTTQLASDISVASTKLQRNEDDVQKIFAEIGKLGQELARISGQCINHKAGGSK